MEASVETRAAYGDLHVWWTPNPPREAFRFKVASPAEARIVLAALTQYDLYLGEGMIESNVGGLEVYCAGGEWEEWHDEDGNDIDGRPV